MGDPEDYSIAREGVWGREGLAAAAGSRLADDGKRFSAWDRCLANCSSLIGGVWGRMGSIGPRAEAGG